MDTDALIIKYGFKLLVDENGNMDYFIDPKHRVSDESLKALFGAKKVIKAGVKPQPDRAGCRYSDSQGLPCGCKPA